MLETAGRWITTAEHDRDREIEAIARARDRRGSTGRDELAAEAGARDSGSGRFAATLREAVDKSRARQVSHASYGPPACAPKAVPA